MGTFALYIYALEIIAGTVYFSNSRSYRRAAPYEKFEMRIIKNRFSVVVIF